MSETQDNQKASQADAARPPLSDLLPCPRCKNNTGERTSFHDDQCCISCKCGYMGPISEFGEDAEFLWNNLAR